MQTRKRPAGFTAAAMFLLVALSLAPTGCTQESPPATRPNFLFILLDDVRWDDLGYAGHPFVQTPNIDRIVREGVQFSNSFAATPLCSPNRASILTGQYAHTHGIVDNVDRSEESHQLVTFPRLLNEAGYETAFIGKWHMGVDDTRRPGFDYWLSIKGQGYYFDPEVNENGEYKKLPGYATDIFSQRTVDFLSQQREQPFLLYLSHKAVHPNIYQYADGSIGPIPADGGFTPAERHKDLYAGEQIPRRPNTKVYGEGKPALLRKIDGLPALGPDTGTPDDVILNRLRMLTAADEGIGKILKALEDSNQLDDTVIIFTSDHGYFYGEHGLYKERRLAYDEIARTPLAFRYAPMIEPGRVVDSFVLSIDLAPTVLELAGAQSPESIQGSSLVPFLEGREPDYWRRSILIEYFSDTVWPRLVTMGYEAVRNDRWKYIRYTDLEGMDELYNLQADPFEIKNLIDDQDSQAALEDLKHELQVLRMESKAPSR